MSNNPLVFDEPHINMDVHITQGKNGNCKIAHYDGFAVARIGGLGFFFDETSIPFFTELLDAAKSVAPRPDTIRNDSPGIQESTERILSETKSNPDIDEQGGSALDIPFQA